MLLFRIGFINISLIDLLDISLVTFIIYEVYIALKGTRAAQMLIGLVTIFILSFIVDMVRMSGMSWIFQNIKTVWVIAFVIIFQPELRRLLVLAGQSRIVRFFIKYEESKILDQITKASVELSKRRYGALIVLTRETGLKTVIETGITLNAKVTEQLLVTIFSPRSPLHDGAVIVKNDMIVAAKCLLPLSQNPMDPSLGTRHKAALGISEESDAVVIVVSEETSIISTAVNGELSRNLDQESLYNLLVDAFRQRTISNSTDIQTDGAV